MVVKGIGKPNTNTLHDRKAGSIDERELMEVSRSKVSPRKLKVLQFTRDNARRRLVTDRVFLRQGDVTAGIPIEEGECLDDHRNRGMQLCASGLQQFPLLDSDLLQRIASQGECDPRSTKTASPCRI